MDINNDHKENESSVYEEENVIEETESSIKRGRIFVYVRIRPFIPSELEEDNTTPIKSIDTINNKLTCKKKSQS